MAKLSGLGMTLTVQDAGGSARTLTNDCLDITLTTPIGTFDVTGLDKSALERLAGLEDAKIAATFGFNNASNQSHPVFSGSKATARQWVIGFPGGTGATATLTTLLTSVAWPRSANGQLQIKVNADLSNGTATAWS